VQAQFTYTTNAGAPGTITITGYSGTAGTVLIPTNVDGLTVSTPSYLARHIPQPFTASNCRVSWWCPNLVGMARRAVRAGLRRNVRRVSRAGVY